MTKRCFPSPWTRDKKGSSCLNRRDGRAHARLATKIHSKNHWTVLLLFWAARLRRQMRPANQAHIPEIWLEGSSLMMTVN